MPTIQIDTDQLAPFLGRIVQGAVGILLDHIPESVAIDIAANPEVLAQMAAAINSMTREEARAFLATAIVLPT